MKSKLGFLLVMSFVAVSCSPTILKFDGKDMKKYFLKEFLPKDTANVQVSIFRTRFDEVLVEDQTLIEVTLFNETTAQEQVRYRVEKLDYRELYMFQWLTPSKNPRTPDRWDENYVYFSVKFRDGIEITPEGPKAKKICLGFGPSYYGQSQLVADHKVITFGKTLKHAKHDGRYYLKHKNSSDSLVFVIRPGDSSESRFKVSKVVNAAPNKIGGTKNLVYNVDSVMNDTTALVFKYINNL